MQKSLLKLLIMLFVATCIFASMQYYLKSQSPVAPVTTVEQKSTLDFSQYLVELQGTEIPDAIAQQYVSELGAEESMRVLTTERPHCHSEAHAFGRAFYKNLDFDKAVLVCGRSCSDGCFHGAVMGLFSSTNTESQNIVDHNALSEFTLADVSKKIQSLCQNESIQTVTNGRTGDCMHAAGHAALYVSNYELETALAICSLFPTAGEQYYCATGVYMERNIAMSDVDNAKTLYAPCTDSALAFPAACYRYELQEIYDKKLASQEAVLNHCLSLTDATQQRGCFHGYGFAYHYSVQTNLPNIATLCQYGDSIAQELCVEGAIGAAGNQIPETIAEACTYLPTELKSACMTGVIERSFGMNRDFTRYVNP